MDKIQLEYRLKQAVSECKKASKERSEAVMEKESLEQKLSAALEKYYIVKAERDVALAEQRKLLCERDLVFNAHAETKKLYDDSLCHIEELVKQLSMEEKTRQSAEREVNDLTGTKNKLQSLFANMSEQVASLRSRVKTLESASEKKSVTDDGVATRPPLTSVKLFVSKLFLSVPPRERLNAMFDLVYENVLSFRNHVNSQVRESIMDSCRVVCHKEVKNLFSGWKFLKALDCSTQSLNQVSNTLHRNSFNYMIILIYLFVSPVFSYQECYKILYSVQRNFPSSAKVLPEIQHIQRAQYSLNRHLDDVIPISQEENWKTAKFDYRAFTDYILTKFGLMPIITNEETINPVIAVTFDGGTRSKFLSHVTGGFKLVDPCCINPLTGEPLFGENGCTKVQSLAHCFPIKIAIAKDSKQLYCTEFVDLFAFFKEYEREHGFRIKFVFPQDMSSIWKTTGRGGTAKVKTFPCYCCSITTATLVTPQPKNRCFWGEWCQQPKCFHHDMLTEATFEAWEEQRAVLLMQYPYLLHPSPELTKSRVILSTIDELRDDTNPFDIAFRPRTIEQG
jgi:hypothetical protein